MKDTNLFKTIAEAMTSEMRYKMVSDLIEGGMGMHSLTLARMTDEDLIVTHSKKFPVPFDGGITVA